MHACILHAHASFSSQFRGRTHARNLIPAALPSYASFRLPSSTSTRLALARGGEKNHVARERENQPERQYARRWGVLLSRA